MPNIPTTATNPANPANAANAAGRVVVGRIIGAYGVRGWLKASPFNAAQESVLLSGRHWWLDRPPGVLQIIQSRSQGSTVVAQAHDITVREAAEALKGASISISRAEFPVIADGEYYWVDLIGCDVVDPGGTPLGKVLSLDDHGGHSLLNVAAPDGVARLIPFVAAVIQSVDLPARRIVADWRLDY